MSFGWNSVGRAPAPDEVEVTVFGPGFGECVLVHLGSAHWVVVDSCTDASDREDRRPAAERYLRVLGVDPATDVKLIVATHWHDDHVRGMARLVEVCTSATFSCANALLRREFVEYVQSLSTQRMTTDGAKVREIGRVFERLRSKNRSARYANGSRPLYTIDEGQLSHGRRVTVTALSPSDREFELFLQHVAEMMPTRGRPAMAAPPRQNPNLASVVLAISVGDVHLSLAADMELHSEQGRGWNAVFGEAAKSFVSPASMVKVAHHGSRNGHHEPYWSAYIAQQPHCVVTPFNRLAAGRRLPTDDDIERLTTLGPLYVTGARSLPKSVAREAAVERGLRESGIELRDLQLPLGMVRLRRAVGAGGKWRAETFPPAYRAGGRRASGIA